MKDLFFKCLLVFCLFSCRNDSKKFTGYYKNTNPKAFVNELFIRQIRDNLYEINFGNDIILYQGIREGNRITAKLIPDPYMEMAGIKQDSTTAFYDFFSDGNQLTVSSEDMVNVEMFIKIKK
jgi:hypothetical protein